jgi:hypothetical protein
LTIFPHFLFLYTGSLLLSISSTHPSPSLCNTFHYHRQAPPTIFVTIGVPASTTAFIASTIHHPSPLLPSSQLDTLHHYHPIIVRHCCFVSTWHPPLLKYVLKLFFYQSLCFLISKSIFKLIYQIVPFWYCFGRVFEKKNKEDKAIIESDLYHQLTFIMWMPVSASLPNFHNRFRYCFSHIVCYNIWSTRIRFNYPLYTCFL